MTYNLLCINNVKINKGIKWGYLNAILHLAPAKLSGYEVCPKRSSGCTKSCLNMAGRGRFDGAQLARIRKTRLLFEDRDLFLNLLRKDIEAIIRKADRENMIPCFRLNGTSDLSWELDKFGCIFKEYPNVQFYDYTKILARCKPDSKARSIPNYHLTFSKSECNWSECTQALDYGINVAAVFEKVPRKYEGYRVINGDQNDLRFLDKKGVIVGLKYKKSFDNKTGKAKQDSSGFVIPASNKSSLAIFAE